MKILQPARLIAASALVALAGILLGSCGTAQPVAAPATPQEIRSAIDNNRWIFEADRSDPPIGRSTRLSLGYQVRLSGDSAMFNLPYSGRMEGPARFPDGKGPLDFTSTRFSINKTEKSAGKWMVTIKPDDAIDVVSGTFTFFDNGTASLDVRFTNRSPIEFFGKIEPIR